MSDRHNRQMTPRRSVSIVQELIERMSRRDPKAIDDLIAEDMDNHAAGPQGREGWRAIMATVEHDLGPVTVTTHRVFGDGDLVAHHMTIHGTHRASTMPLLAGLAPTGREVSWDFIHIWRVAGGQIVEHWATRDDLGLLAQLRPT